MTARATRADARDGEAPATTWAPLAAAAAAVIPIASAAAQTTVQRARTAPPGAPLSRGIRTPPPGRGVAKVIRYRRVRLASPHGLAPSAGDDLDQASLSGFHRTVGDGPPPASGPKVMSDHSLDTGELLRTRPHPLTAEQLARLRGTPPAGPPPRPATEPGPSAAPGLEHRHRHGGRSEGRPRPSPRPPHRHDRCVRDHPGDRARRRRNPPRAPYHHPAYP